MSSFPYKLHQLLTDIEENEELSSIISWLPNGNGFRIHKPVLFETFLLKKYFPRQSKLKSFKRQVQYYGFGNLSRGSYTHPSFVRGKRSLCGRIVHKLPMKSIKTTKAAAAAAAAAKANNSLSKATGSRSPSPNTMAAMSMSMPLGSNNLPMLNPQAFVMSPNEPALASMPKGQGSVLPMFASQPSNTATTIDSSSSSLNYLNQLKQQSDLQNSFNQARSFQQQAMQEYLKILLSR
mmetsp:Transcript_22976/g.56614  ORF Transcript_22976/g.56614 Transcript_22976/m.56614 type:complete len:236 (-) Transcript_22976:120-827(-)|eukprot:CAMPEP_0113626666 /NCGR_PEP_ID=MMETSP0017_2-20120614/13795_1 /TAXON_ID=2856 /ORGANISM="Cylindrotheca closterium" /LENGTH=235 /DNA_ID=CAMNT_0000536863 /DNA_START=83 /DNA_END=790 /DNA_ORIENTATION=+ /assembly_acc=CAM_ASM_000147